MQGNGKVLVTGGLGFIGTNLCARLLKEGNEVICIDDCSGKYPEKTYSENRRLLEGLGKFTLIKESLLDEKTLARLKGKGISAVVHLAAKTGVRDSIKKPEDYFETNVIGALRVMDFARSKKIPRLVIASTSSVYGKNRVPFNETMPIDTPLSPYAASKCAMEHFAYSYFNTHKTNITLLRFFTVYGPHGRHDMAVYKFAKLISEGKPIEVYGDGSQKRDFTFIDDVVSGIISALEKCNGFNVYNIGCSDTVELSKMISLLEENLGKKAIIKNEPEKPEDVFETYADISKAKKELGFSPKTGLSEGIRAFSKWFLKMPQ